MKNEKTRYRFLFFLLLLPVTAIVQAQCLSQTSYETNSVPINGNNAYNCALGWGVLTSLPASSMGTYNSACGYEAAHGITTGSFNTAAGAYSLTANATGSVNVAVGYYALAANASFSNCTGAGAYALYANTANNNTAAGFKSLYNNTSGTPNEAFGENALYANLTGTYNVAMGYKSLTANTTGYENVALGSTALSFNTTGFANAALGYQALLSNTSGYGNCALGETSLSSNTIGEFNTAIGVSALQNNNSSVTYQAFYNTAAGFDALLLNTTASRNAGLGSSALFKNTTGTDNTAVGEFALYTNTTASDNTAVGTQALQSSNSAYNCAFGYSALEALTSGNSCTAMGRLALQTETTGSDNSALGCQALSAQNGGSGNTAIGYEAGETYTNTDCTFLGIQSGSNGNYTNSLALGGGAIVGSSNSVQVGDVFVNVIEGQVAYSYPSDARFKTDVKEEVKGIEFIKKLRPVVYNFDTRKYDEFMVKDMPENAKASHFALAGDYAKATAVRQTGFIAQEVEKAANACGYDFDGIVKPASENDCYRLTYSQFVVPLVKGMQQQQQVIETRQQIIASGLSKIKALSSQLQTLKQGCGNGFNAGAGDLQQH